MSTLQHDEAMIQALAITKAQAGVRSMSAEEIVTYINDLVRAIRSTLDKNTEDDGQAEEKVDTEGLDPRKSIRENLFRRLHRDLPLQRRYREQRSRVLQNTKIVGYKCSVSECRSFPEFRWYRG